MNDEMEMIEEFQSESIEDLVVERRKEKAVQHFLTNPSSKTRYYLFKWGFYKKRSGS